MIALRWLAGVIALAAGITAGVYVSRIAAAGVEPWSSWREAVRPDGLVIITISVVWLLIAAVLQTPMAFRRGARVGAGWLVIAGLLAFHLLVALFAVWLADISTEQVPGGEGRQGEDHTYAMVLLSLLWLSSLYTLTGLWFLRPAEPEVSGTTTETTGPSGTSLLLLSLNVIATISVAPAWVFFAYIVIGASDRYELPFIPSDGMPAVAMGLALAVPSLFIYATRRYMIAVLIWDLVSPLHLALGAPAVLLFTVLLAQAVRVVDSSLVVTVAVVGLPAAYGWLLRYLHQRFPAPMGDDHYFG
jgi:hypothetical protein